MKEGRFAKNLSLLIGQWSVAMTTYSSTGLLRSDLLTATKNWIAEGRYVEESIEGVFAGSRHEKRTLLTFNATRKRYEYVTADNHDTVLLLYTSDPLALSEAHRIDLWTDYVSPGDAAPRGVLLRVRTTVEILDENSHTVTNFYANPGETERPFLEYKYWRQG